MKKILDSDLAKTNSKPSSSSNLKPRKFSLITISFSIFVACFILISLGVFYSKISFGNGMGDLAMWFGYFLSVILVGIYFCFMIAMNKEYKIVNLFIVLIMLFSLIYIILRITIWRGGEIPWNGNIFV